MRRARLHLRGVVVVALVLLHAARAPDVFSQPPAQPHGLEEYFALARQARTGDVRAAAAEIRTWNPRTFRDLRDELEQRRSGLEGPDQRILGKWGRADLEALAMLHTEVAIRLPAFSTERTSHGNWAKQLLELFDGLAVDQSFRRRWQLAWGAHLQSELRLRELADHLHHARQKFPEDPALVTMAGMMYESWARRASLLRPDADYVPMELRRELPERRKSEALAQEHYRRALAIEAGLLDARVRLARMLLEANRFDEATAEITRAADGAASAKDKYLVHMLRGRIHATAKRWHEAADAYADAGRLLPECQSWMVALSHVLVHQGQRPQAQADVTRAVVRPELDRCRDPWWEYDFGYGAQAEALFDQLRETLR
jgi:tetratricopeptide (TPR) repeat protein